MSMATRINVGIGVILGMVALLLAFGIYRVAFQQDQAAEVTGMAVAVNKLDRARMLNRLHLHRFLLNGDTAQANAIAQGSREINDLINVTEQKAIRLGEDAEQAKQYLEDMRRNETLWEHEFASPLMDRRRLVDSGEFTVAELQIAFLQENPDSWDHKEADLDKELDRIVDRAKAKTQLSGADPMMALLKQIFGGFIGVAIVAIIIASRLVNAPSAPQTESLPMAPR